MPNRLLYRIPLFAIAAFALLACDSKQNATHSANADLALLENKPVVNYEAAFEAYRRARSAIQADSLLAAAQHYLAAAQEGFDPEQAYLYATLFFVQSGEVDAAMDAALLLAQAGYRDLRPFAYGDAAQPIRDHAKWPQLEALISDNKAQYEAIHRNPANARIETSDIDRFWVAFDRAAEVSDFAAKRATYLAEYFNPGTVGLRDYTFSKMRGGIDDFIAFVEDHRPYYAGVRSAIEAARESLVRLPAHFQAVQAVIPEATFSDFYFVIGRHTSFGTVSMNGSLIGLENVVDATTPVETLPEDRQNVVAPASFLPFVLIHELIHTYQNTTNKTLLEATITEGVADLVTELILGPPQPTPNYRIYGEANEARIWALFQEAMDGTSRTGWIGDITQEEALEPGWVRDLAYFVGYKIAKAYYDQAEDKQQALRDLLDNRDAHAILEASGYQGR